MSSSTTKPAASQQQKRRQRIFLRMAVQISGIRTSGKEFHELAHSVIVNANGGMMELREPVVSQQSLKVKNMETEQEILCTVVHLSKDGQGTQQVAIEFNEPAPNFWRVSFPPLNWNPSGPESKRFTPFKVPDKVPIKKK